MSPLRPVVTLPQDPIAVAEITASCIRADARTGGSVPLSTDAIYFEDPTQGPNMLLSPAEVAARGGGQCFDLVRSAGGYQGTHIGCQRTPGGFHVWLAYLLGDEDPIDYDISKDRGMPGEPEYAGAVYVPIWQPGPGGIEGPPGHDQPPQQTVGSAALPPEAWADFVVTVGAPLVPAESDPSALRATLEQALAESTSDSRSEAIASLLLIVRALTEARANEAVRSELSQVGNTMSSDAAKLVGALAVLSGRPWRSMIPAANVRRIPRRAPQALPTSARVSPILPSGSCPGSCAIPRR